MSWTLIFLPSAGLSFAVGGYFAVLAHKDVLRREEFALQQLERADAKFIAAARLRDDARAMREEFSA